MHQSLACPSCAEQSTYAVVPGQAVICKFCQTQFYPAAQAAPGGAPVQQVIVQQAATQSNGLGVAGFVISLVGLLLTCGFICPLGVILSGAGLAGNKPKGLAIAGLVIGLIGSLWVAMILFGVLATPWSRLAGTTR